MPVYQDKDKNDKPIKTKDGRSWYFKTYKKDFNKKNKQYESKKYFTKKEAQKAERLFIMKRDNPARKPFSLVAKDYFDTISKVRKQSTCYTYKKDYDKHIKPFFEKYNDINEITVQIIEDWGIELEKSKISVKYMNKIRSLLLNIFNHAMKMPNGLQINPVAVFGTFQEKQDKIVEDGDKIRYITYEEFKQFINVANEPLWHAFFTFAYYTGCRPGEIKALTWNDINFETKEIKINKNVYEDFDETSTKNRKNRRIKMSQILYDEMKNYKEYVSKYTDFREGWYVFGNTKHLSKTTINRHKDNYFKLCNKDKPKNEQIQKITLNEFRHSHVSLLINEYVKTSKEKNMKIDTAKFFLIMSDRMGHTIAVMQKTYMHLFPTIQDEIVDLLDNL